MADISYILRFNRLFDEQVIPAENDQEAVEKAKKFIEEIEHAAAGVAGVVSCNLLKPIRHFYLNTRPRGF